MEDGLVHLEQFKITNAHEIDNKHLEVFINKKEAIYVLIVVTMNLSDLIN